MVVGFETPEGKKASKIRVYVESAQLLGGQGQGGGGSGGDRSDSSTSYDSGVSSGYDDYPAGDDDIPF